ncbi:MAG TPA: hypothetical protein VKE40_01250 [Gemmataceae bacterium]|nr:hypothetical protein [Gemmataceae bacterium]
MLKKVFVVGAAGLLTAAVLTQTKLGDLAWGWVDRAERSIESKIKPEDEIRRIKHEVASLDRDIDKAKGALAEENVEVRYLTKRVDELRVSVEKSRSAVEARRDLFKGETSFIKWDGRNISTSKAKELLAAEVSNHKALNDEFKAQEKMLAIRERTRTMAEQHLQALVTQKAELETAVTDVEAEIKLAKIEQVQSKYQNDGSRMAKVKEDLAKLRKRIEIQREKLALTKKIDPTSVENKSVDEIFAELDSKGEKASDQLGRK